MCYIFLLATGVLCPGALVDHIIKVAGNQDRHKSLDAFDFRLDQTTHFGVICP